MVTLLVRRGLLSSALLVASLTLVAANASAAPVLDASFGGGVITPKVFPDGKWRQSARGAALQPDGKVVVPMGLSVNYGRRAERPVLRYNADGTLDTTFGKNGVAWFRIPGINFFGLEGITQLPNGSFLIRSIGSRKRPGPVHQAITQLTSTGAVDRTFGDRGSVVFPVRKFFKPLLAVELARGGSIVAAFRNDVGYGSNVTLVRLRANGKVDRSFANNGARTVKLSGDQNFPTLTDFEVAGDKIYLLALNDFEGGRVPCKLIRISLDREGRPDRSFGKGGSVMLGAGDKRRSMSCGQVVPTSDGGVAVATTSYDENTFDLTPIGIVFKLRPDGSRDPAFGAGGRATVGSDGANGIAQSPDGSFLVTGDRTAEHESTQAAGGTATVIDSRGTIASVIAGGVIPGLTRCIAGKVSSGSAGSVVVYTRRGSKGELGTRIVKFTN